MNYCFGMLATAYRNIQNSLTWVKQYLDYTTGAIERLNTALESTKLALEKERCRIIEAVLAGYVDSSSSSAGLPTFTTTDHDANELPPPVYEAPPTSLDSNTLHQNNMPNIPTNITPTSSLSNFPLNDHSPVIPDALPSPVDSSAPPHPITPVFGDTHINNTPNNQPYVSSNSNNPFK
ncbi:hypothetical protein HPULCUR_004474 [Helicostylum pulchrum]|uniref:Uncharacterized protein n=1 Tax=Helicostylum pulchrum TaxID=562976 RepID=A0ABP9XWA7_9FUNG